MCSGYVVQKCAEALICPVLLLFFLPENKAESHTQYNLRGEYSQQSYRMEKSMRGSKILESRKERSRRPFYS